MSRKESQPRASFSPTQRKACFVLAGCVAAVILSVVAAWVLPGVLLGASAGTGNYDPDAYPVDTTLDAVLTETSDAGSEYISQTVFAGDDNVVALTSSGQVTIDRYVGRDGLGVSDLIQDSCVYFEDDSAAHTIPQAIAKMKPRRVIVMLGSNNVDASMDSNTFLADYRQALKAIQSAYSYCDIIVSAIPPVAEDSADAAAVQTRIDQFNQALAQMCQSDGYKYLNSAEVLKGENGYAVGSYVSDAGGVLTGSGVNTYLSYVTTHAYETEDRRPDTDDIPRRAAQAAAETPATPSPTPLMHTVSYGIQSGEGTLEYDGQSNVSFRFQVADGETIKVTAVPKEGFTFAQWSDGVKDATRVEKVDEDVEVSAIFNDARVGLTLDKGDTTITLGESFTVSANVTLGGDPTDNSLVQWAVNDDLQATAGGFTFTPTQTGTYTIKAGVEINGGRDEKTLTLTVSAPATTIRLTAPVTMQVGSTATLYVEVENGNGETTWSCPQLPGWNPTGNSVQFTTSTAGTYEIQATNNGVTGKNTIVVTAAPTPSPQPAGDNQNGDSNQNGEHDKNDWHAAAQEFFNNLRDWRDDD